MKGFIYIIRNNVNEKVYIGKTIKTIEIRWAQHKSTYMLKRNDKNHFCRALRIYGIDKFYVQLLECVESKSKKELIKKLNKKERYYIKKYDSYKNGYNSTLGGDGGEGHAISDEGKQKLRKLKTGKSPSQESIMKSASKHRGLKMKNHVKKKLSKAHNIKICQYSPNGELIKEWDSIKDATIAMGLKSTSSIRQCLIGKCKLSAGFVWKYKYQNKPKDKEFKRQVEQYTIDDQYVREYVSIAEAVRNNPNTTSGSIVRCCKGQYLTSGGYKWKYKLVK